MEVKARRSLELLLCIRIRGLSCREVLAISYSNKCELSRGDKGSLSEGGTRPKCRKCGREMKFLGEDAAGKLGDRWYCYKDDEVYLSIDSVWNPPQSHVELPPIVPWPELHDITIVPSCEKCGARMELRLQGRGVETRGRWVCPKGWHVLTEDQVEELRRKRADIEPSYAILMIRQQHDWRSGLEVSQDHEVTVEAISERNEEVRSFHGKHFIATSLVLGPAFGSVAAMTPRTVFDSMDEAQRRMKKDPYRYPYSRFKIDMLCPKCRTKVRADMEHCEQCGTKFVVPIPLYLSF
jgi:hypothetical protein